MSSVSEMSRFFMMGAADLCVSHVAVSCGYARVVKEVSAMCAGWMWAFRSNHVDGVQIGGQHVCDRL